MVKLPSFSYSAPIDMRNILVFRYWMLLAITLATPCLAIPTADDIKWVGQDASIPVKLLKVGPLDDYKTIGDAVAAANPGDVVQIEGGHYSESLVIDKSIHLTGRQGGGKVFLKTDKDAAITVDADFAGIYDMDIQTAAKKTAAIDIRRGRVSLRGCAIRAKNGEAIKIEGPESRVLVKNCVLSDSQIGLTLMDEAQAVVTETRIERNTVGVLAFEDVVGKISKSEISSNFKSGVIAFHEADILLLQNRIDENAEAGVFIQDGAMGRILNNQIRGNDHVGIYIKEAGPLLIRNNEISENSKHGIEITATQATVLNGNVVRMNSGNGILVESSIDLELNGNTLSDNRATGLFFTKRTTACVLGGKIDTNGNGGLQVKSGSKIKLNQIGIKNNEIFGVQLQGGRIQARNLAVTGNAGKGVRMDQKSRLVIRDSVLRDNAFGAWSIPPEAKDRAKIINVSE